MNNVKCFLILFCFVFVLTNKPFAQTSSLAEGCSPLEVQFFAPAGSSTYFWDFQDNATSTLEDPSNTFIDPGTYEVEFSESVNGPVIGTVTITVFPAPVLSITGVPLSGCTPLNVQFESTSTIDPGITVNNYSWVFGDGGTANNNSMPSHTYTSEGLFTVSFNIETNIESCNVTEIFSDFVAVSTIPGVGFTTTPNPPSSCTAPFEVAFNNTTSNPQGLTFEWDFGNGTTFSGPDPGPQTFGEGSFTVQLTATDAVGCAGIFTQTVSVGTPFANFVIPDSICVNVEYDMENMSDAGFYTWDFGPNAIPTTSNNPNPQNVIFTTQGFHDISLTVASPAGCIGDTTITVYVDSVDASFASTPIYSCAEPLVVSFDPNSTTITEWDWSFTGGASSTEENPVHEYFNEDVTIYSVNGELLFFTSLTATNALGCVGSFLDTVILNEPNALFMPDVINGCAPLTVELSDSSTSIEPIVLWEWDYGDGQTATFNNGDPHEHIFTDPGEYNVQLIVTNDAGCTDTSYILIIEVGGPISPDLMVDVTEVCPGDSVQFTNLTPLDNIDAFHYTTDNGRSFHCFDEPDLTWAFVEETGPMDVTLTVEYNGCFSTVTYADLITVNGPIAQIDYLVDCANPYDIAFSSQSMDATNITWDFGDGNTSTIPDLTHTYDSTGTYWVTLTAENNVSGCPASIDSMQIFVTDILASFALDTILCAGVEYPMDASASVDVDASCWRGYSWYFSFNRPITTPNSSLPMEFPSGDHSVTLVARDINGCLDTAELEVRAFGSSANFEFDNDRICIPSDVSFTDLSVADTTIVDWNWEFGDGGTSTDQNPTYTYDGDPTVNSLTVSLNTTDAVGCNALTMGTIQVYQPTSSINTTPIPNLCAGDEIQFSATDFTQEGSNLTYMWDFANGTTGTGNTGSATYLTGGTYPVVVNYEEVATGCQNSSTVNVQVQDYPQADFTSNFDGLSIICYPQNGLFNDNSTSNSALTYEWDFGNGQMATGSSPGAGFDKGTFEVEMIASTSFGCSDTTYNTYTLIGPEGDFAMDPNMICLGDFVNFTLLDTVDISSFSWDFGDGVVADNINPTSHQYNFLPPSGQTVATLILRSANDACTIPIEKSILIHEVIADFTVNDGIDTSTCVNEAVVFMNNSTGSDIYSWNFGNGNSSTTENPDNVFTESGTYDVLLSVESSAFGCVDDIVKPVTVFALPNTVAIGDTICEDDLGTLSIVNPSNGSNYFWSPDNLISINNSATSTTLGLNNSTTFTVEELDANGCINTDEINVQVIPPFPSIEWDSLVCEGEDAFLPLFASSSYNIEWTPAIVNCATCPPTLVEAVNDNITYTAIVTDAFGLGCDETVSTFNIEVVKATVEIPNAFTPDADGTNDFFNVIISTDLVLEDVIDEFKIWNRWGELVYDNDTPMTGWDGTHKGKPGASDVYIYEISVSTDACNIARKTGSVTLIR